MARDLSRPRRALAVAAFGVSVGLCVAAVAGTVFEAVPAPFPTALTGSSYFRDDGVVRGFVVLGAWTFVALAVDAVLPASGAATVRAERDGLASPV